MLYLERIPAAPLNRFVKFLWYANAPQVGHGRERVLPTGRTQIILNLARDFLLDCPEGQRDRPMPPSAVIGARSIFEIVDTSDMAELIGIPYGEVTQVGMFPVAYTVGTEFRPASRALSEQTIHWNAW